MSDPAAAAPADPQASAPGANVAGEVADVSKYVEDLLSTMDTQFKAMSSKILGRMEEMGTRIDDLEKSIGGLISQAEASVLTTSAAAHGQADGDAGASAPTKQ